MKYKQRLAIVISSLEVGGAEKMVVEIVENIKDLFNLKLFVIKKNYHTIYDEKIKAMGVQVEYFNHRIKIFSLRVAEKLKLSLDDFAPDIIHTHLKASTYVYYYYLFNPNFKWIHTVHTIAYVDTKIIRRQFFRPLYNQKIIKLVAVGNNVKKTILELYPHANCITIPNGVNLDKFYPLHKNHEGINLICVGRLERIKNHEYLLKELSRVDLSKINKLFIVGEGKCKNSIIKLIKKLHLEDVVEMVGYTDNVFEYLSLSDFFILPSLYEGLPLSVIEALACGLIVITGSGGSDIITNNVDGFIIDLKANALANKLKFIINNLSNLTNMQTNAYLKAKEFSIENMVNKYLDIYLEGDDA